MTTSERQHMERIDRYLEEQMAPPEQAAFEQEMSQNQQLAQDVAAQRQANSLVQDYGLLQVRNKLQQIHAQEQALQSSSTTQWRHWLVYGRMGLAALGLALILFLGLGDQTNDSKPKTAQQEQVALKKPKAPQQEKPWADQPTPNLPQQSAEPTAQPAETPSPDNSTPQENPAQTANRSQPQPDPERQAFLQRKNETAEELPSSQGNNSWSAGKLEGDQAPEAEALKAIKTENQTEARDCQSLQFTGEPQVFPACQGQSNGMIALPKQAIRGGTAPYRLSVDHGKTFGHNGKIRSLEAGTYNLWLYDHNGCSRQVAAGLEVPATDCLLPPVLRIAPSSEESFYFPNPKGKNAEVLIISKAGQVVYRQQLQPGKNPWNGQDNTGQPLPMGSYRYQIHFQGNQQAPQTGRIELVR